MKSCSAGSVLATKNTGSKRESGELSNLTDQSDLTATLPISSGNHSYPRLEIVWKMAVIIR